MKKIYSILIIFALLFSGCANSKKIDDIYYTPYGILNEDVSKNPEIEYQLNTGNILVMILFSWSIVIPLYVGGFQLYEPVKKKDSIFFIQNKKGAVLK